LTSTTARKSIKEKIDISTYDCGEDKLIIAGQLKENRLIPCYKTSGEEIGPDTVHHMIIRLLIDLPALTITDIEVEMAAYPHDECPEAIKRFDQIKGMTIAPGFSSMVRKKIGGTKGCAHMTTLMLAMGPAAMQGVWTHRMQQPVRELPSSEVLEKYLIDTCWVWRKGGRLAKQFGASN
jgi:hypothetical protein